VFKIVVNGSFDIVHVGHLRLFEHARSYPNSYVYVLIDSDDLIKQLKGQDRPINNEQERQLLLSSLRTVDRVEVFRSHSELAELIKNYQPDLMIKGSDYKNKPIVGAEYCKQIEFFDRLNEYSTTDKILKCRTTDAE
jgi:rfaE bifunctional protein nucleotidyltransferase chain/domain